MKPPRVVYVGAADYDVKVVKRLDLFGETNNELTEILLKSSQSPSAMRDTLLHEVLHAITFLSGLHKTLGLNHDEEEKMVVTITPWILAALRDNPRLVAFLVEGAEGVEAA